MKTTTTTQPNNHKDFYQMNETINKSQQDPYPSTNKLHTNQPTNSFQAQPNTPNPRLQPTSTPASSRSLSHGQRWYDRFKFSSVQYALLTLLALQSIAVISILSTTVAKIEKEIQFTNPQLRTISTYLAIFIIANIFLILMTIDLLLNKNVVQLIALCFFNTSMAVYGAVLPNQIQRALHNPGGAISWNGAREGTSCNMYLSCYGVQYLYGDIAGWIITIPVIGGIVSILMAYLTWLIYKEFGWEIFKLIGADLGLKRILQKKYLFHMLQKFALFFFIGLSLQFLMLASSMSSSERILTICALPFSLGVVMLGGFAVSKEIRWMMGVYYVCWTAATVYFVFKLIRLYDNDSISAAVRSLTIFSVLTIALLFATGIVSILCYQNFGKGLLEAPAVLNESLWTKFWGSRSTNGQETSGNGTRKAGITSKTAKLDRHSRMTLGGRGGTQEELSPPDGEGISVIDNTYHRQAPTRPDMIQLTSHPYRMSMD